MEPNPAFYKKQIRDLAYYQNGISAGNKFVLAEAITLIENNKEEKRPVGKDQCDRNGENNVPDNQLRFYDLLWRLNKNSGRLQPLVHLTKI